MSITSLVLIVASCFGQSADLPARRNPLARPAPAPSHVMRFHTASVQDQDFGGEALRLLVPTGWKVEGGPKWDFTRPAFPATASLRVFNPNGVEQLSVFPTQYMFWSENPTTVQLVPRGSKYYGCTVTPPPNSMREAMIDHVLPAYRGNVRNGRIVAFEELPKLVEELRRQNPGQPGVTDFRYAAARVRIEYEENGQMIEEDVYGVLWFMMMPQIQSMNWTMDNLCAFRAPKGRLDAIRPTMEAISTSFRPNLEWYNQYMQVCQILHGGAMDAIAEAGKRSRIISQMNKDVSDTIRQSHANQQASYDRIAEARGETNRGVETYVNARYQERIELPGGYDNAWVNDRGEYVLSPSVSFDPNVELRDAGNWTKLQKKD